MDDFCLTENIFHHVIQSRRTQKKERQGIGTMGEKTVHAVLKDCYTKEEGQQEIPVSGFVADIFTGRQIIEIQTRNFNALRKKLECFLKLCPVTVVYPIAHIKWLIWIDEETGEMTAKRKSPVKGTEYLAFSELYKIKNFLSNDNFSIRLVLLDMEEYRLLNGWSKDKKKGSTRYDRLPVKLIRETKIECWQDYRMFIPAELGDGFSVKDFAKAAHINKKLAGLVVHILHEMGVIKRTGKKGNAWLYNMD